MYMQCINADTNIERSDTHLHKQDLNIISLSMCNSNFFVVLAFPNYISSIPKISIKGYQKR